MASTRREREKKRDRYVSAKERADKAEASGGFSAIKLPKGVGRFSFDSSKTYHLDLLPYKVGKGNPYADYDADDPFLHYERTYWTHKGIGADERQVCCLAQTFHEPCPICEYIKGLDRWGKDKDLYQALRPKQRQIFALIDRDDAKKGVQIFETSFFFGLGEAIDGKAKAKPQRYDGFYHLQGGKTAEVTVSRTKQGGWSIDNLEMEEREDYDDDLLDKVPCLDDMPIKTEYKTLKKMFLEGGSQSKAERNGEPEDSDVDSDEDGSSVEKTAAKVSEKKSKKRPEKDSEVETSSPLEDDSSPAAEESSVEEPSSAEEAPSKKDKSAANSAAKKGTKDSAARTSRSDDDSDVDSEEEDDSPLEDDDEDEDDSDVEDVDSVEEPSDEGSEEEAPKKKRTGKKPSRSK